MGTFTWIPADAPRRATDPDGPSSETAGRGMCKHCGREVEPSPRSWTGLGYWVHWRSYNRACVAIDCESREAEPVVWSDAE